MGKRIGESNADAMPLVCRERSPEGERFLIEARRLIECEDFHRAVSGA